MRGIKTSFRTLINDHDNHERGVTW